MEVAHFQLHDQLAKFAYKFLKVSKLLEAAPSTMNMYGHTRSIRVAVIDILIHFQASLLSSQNFL